MGDQMALVLNEIRNLSNKIVNIEDSMATKADLKGMATKYDIANMATKADLKGMATKHDIANMATKADLKGMATKHDIANMATKADLKGMATKHDIANMATKADLKGLATKQDFENLSKKIDGITKQVVHNSEQIHILHEKQNSFAKKLTQIISVQEQQHHIIDLLSRRSIEHEAKLNKYIKN